jgi:fermentation-respiration switch protein FrsA (DUF1100 family)
MATSDPSTQGPGAASSGETTTLARSASRRGGARWALVWGLVLSGVLGLGYLGLCTAIATQLVYSAPSVVKGTPSEDGYRYSEVTFPSRTDGVMLRGWFIPGVLPDGTLTDRRTVIVVHGNGGNRSLVLGISEDLAHSGFAVLSFDMRGMGQSPPAPLTLGYYEQRDVLGAVDYLRQGQLPFPGLGRPVVIAGWGVSMGAATMLLAAAQEPAITAVVSDCAYADIVPILEREIPKRSKLPGFFTPGALEAANLLLNVDYYSIRPAGVVIRIAPRPIFFIHGEADTYVPPANMTTLNAAADGAPNAQTQTWLVQGAAHGKSYTVARVEYVRRVVAFYTQAMGTAAQ